MIGLAFLLLLQQGVSERPADVRFGVAVRPDTVTVGDHFDLLVRVRAPRGASISFPTGPDSALSVDAVDPRIITTRPDSAVLEQTARFRLAAWDTGSQRIRLGDVVVTSLGVDRHIPLNAIGVYVRSVLPGDTAHRTPRPARAIAEAARAWWPLALASIVALVALALALRWWLRRRARRGGVVVPGNALAIAQHGFERLEALGLLAAGERGRHVALGVQVLRDYLAARMPTADLSLTSDELLQALRDEPAVPPERLRHVLDEADLVKFARRPVSSERARDITAQARSLVDDVDRTLTARPASSAEHAA